MLFVSGLRLPTPHVATICSGRPLKSSLAAPHSFLAQQVSLPFLSLQTYNSRPSPLTGLVLFFPLLFLLSFSYRVFCFHFFLKKPPLLPFFLRFSFLVEISYAAEFIHRSLLGKSTPSFSLLYFLFESVDLLDKQTFLLSATIFCWRDNYIPRLSSRAIYRTVFPRVATLRYNLRLYLPSITCTTNQPTDQLTMAVSSLLTRVLVFFLLAMLAVSANVHSANGTGLPVAPTTNSTAVPTFTTPAVPTGTSDQPSSANTLSSTVALFGALIAVGYPSTPTEILKLVRGHGD